jgi:2-dehydro-3-deoxyglucarate aldolase/4-hydroxy-2-oxoheptanedioate aldolase
VSGTFVAVRANPIKARLAAGETAYGTMVFEFLSAGLPQVLENAGADFVFYDMEHSGFSMDEIKTQLALCRGLNIVPLVRPPDTTYQHTARLLDLGLEQFLISSTMLGALAQRLVKKICTSCAETFEM